MAYYDFNTGKWVYDTAPLPNLTVAPTQPTQTVKVAPPAPLPTVKVATPTTTFYKKPGDPNPQQVYNSAGQAVNYQQFIAQGGKADFSNVVMQQAPLSVQPLPPQPTIKVGTNTGTQTPTYNPQQQAPQAAQTIQPAGQNLNLNVDQKLSVRGVDNSTPPAYRPSEPSFTSLFIDSLPGAFKALPGALIKADKAILNLGKDIFQGTARSGGSIGATLSQMVGGPSQFSATDPLSQKLFGNEAVKSLPVRILETIPKVQQYAKKANLNLSKGQAAALATPAVLGLTALDFTGWGGEGKAAAKLVAATKVDDVFKILKKINVSDDLIKTYAPKFVETTNPEVAKNLLKNIQELQTLAKERGFITSVKESPNIGPEVKSKVSGTYDPVHNAKTFAKSQQGIQADPQKALTDFFERSARIQKDVGAGYTTDALSLMKHFENAGDAATAARVATTASESLTQGGQFIQAADILNKLSPEGWLVYAAKTMEKASKVPRFAGKIDDLEKGITKIHQETVERVIKETPELKSPTTKIGRQLPDLERKIEQRIANGSISPEQQLADRITPYYKAKQPNPIKDMINTLYKLATEQLPAKGKALPRDALELISKALKDKETYVDIWDKAKVLVKERYADKPEALTLLDEYFGKGAEFPVAEKQIFTAVGQGIKAEKIDLGQIVRQHYTVLDQTGKDLTAKLVERANVSAKDAATLASKIQKRFTELATVRKDSILKSIFAERTPTDKTFVDKLIELSNLGAFNKEQWRGQLAKKLGVPNLSDDVAKKIVELAKEIQEVPENLPYEKFTKTQELTGFIDRNIPKNLTEKAKEWAFELWALPKTVAAGFLDFSGSFRQALFPMTSFPKAWAKGMKAQFISAGSEEGFKGVMNGVMNNKWFKTATDAGISFSDINAKMSGREDRFMSTWAEKIFGLSGKIPVAGKYIPNPIRVSNRAMTGLLNKIRMDMFGSMADTAVAHGITMDSKWLSDTSAFINDATGRGDWKFARGSLNTFLQGIMFSPRLMESRLNLLRSPVSYLSASPQVRKQVWKSLFAFGGSTAAVLGAASFIDGVEVGKDPRSADFAKIKIGNTRIDIAGGFQQYIRIAAQVFSGKYISTTTGKVITLGEGYKPLTRTDILLRGLESKESPFAALISTILTGTNFEGDEVKGAGSISKEFAKKFIPMTLNDIWDVYKDDPKLLPLGFLSLFGEGLQTYPMTPAIEKMKEINVSSDPIAAFEQLKKENPLLAEKVKTAKVQESFTEFDWGLTYMGVENGDRAKFLVERFSRLSSDEERKALWTDLRKKKLISDTVDTQIRYLIENPDFVIPKQ